HTVWCTIVVTLSSLEFSRYFLCSDSSTSHLYTLSLHDALPISPVWKGENGSARRCRMARIKQPVHTFTIYKTNHRRRYHKSSNLDRKSTRLNSSHVKISYAVFCLKKKILMYYSYLYSKICTTRY